MSISLTESWGHPSSFPLRGRWAATHTILQAGPFLPTYWTMRIVVGARPTPYLMQVECPSAGGTGESDGTYYQALNFEKWAACETKSGEPRRFGNQHPALNPFPLFSPRSFLRNALCFLPCPPNLCAP